MKLNFKTTVEQNYQQVFAGFSKDLFTQLAPPFPTLLVERFDGCKQNDEVHLHLDFWFFKQTWVSQIIENQEDEGEIYFIDVGKSLPFFLKQWRHKHIIKKSGDKTIIGDQIEFSCGNQILDLLLVPAMWLQFVYRKPIYRKHFKKQ